MTTATDTWDATWKDTGEHPVVHEDATRLPDDAPVMAMEDVHALAERNAELTDLVHRLTDDKGAAYADVERLSAELDTLREQVGPLDERWTPPTEQPTAWIEEQTIAHRAAEHRPSADTHTYIAGYKREDYQRWTSVHDDIETLTSHEPADVWDDELRALLQPVETDWWEREDRLMVGLVTREQESVYAELAPDRIHAGPEDVPEFDRDIPAIGEYDDPETGYDDDPKPDDRVERMKNNPENYFAEARENATPDRSDIEKMTQLSNEKRQRRDRWWNRHAFDATMAAGLAVAATVIAAAAGVLG